MVAAEYLAAGKLAELTKAVNTSTLLQQLTRSSRTQQGSLPTQ
jgi:hypothetical protein